MQLTKKFKIKNFIVIFLFLINSATSNAQITKFTFFGELNRGVKLFENIQKNTGLTVEELNSILDDRKISWN